MAPIAITHQAASSNAAAPVVKAKDHSVVVEQLAEVAGSVLGQAVELLENTLSDDAQLVFTSKYIPGSTIGKHLRHARDHYILLIQSVTDQARADGSSNKVPANLSYDARIRDTPVETSITAGIQAFKETIASLGEISRYVPEDKPVVLKADTGPYEQVLQSTFGRELWFASLHAIHHWSMIRVIAGELGCTLNANFGVAPSTINHHAKQEAGKAKI